MKNYRFYRPNRHNLRKPNETKKRQEREPLKKKDTRHKRGKKDTQHNRGKKYTQHKRGKKDTQHNRKELKKVRFEQQPAENDWDKFNTDILNYDSDAKKKEIENELGKGGGKVIYGYFWMDGCGYCNNLHPIWKTVVKEMRMNHPEYFDANFRRENMDEAIEVVSEKYNPTTQIMVDSFPTIFLIKNGKLQYYEGERTKDAIINWVITRPG